MVTYWLQGKKTTPVTRDVKESEPTKAVTMETEAEREAAIPGFLSDDLLMDPV